MRDAHSAARASRVRSVPRGNLRRARADAASANASPIVNASRIRTLKALPNTEYTVVLKSGVTLRASRSYADRLRRVLGLT